MPTPWFVVPIWNCLHVPAKCKLEKKGHLPSHVFSCCSLTFLPEITSCGKLTHFYEFIGMKEAILLLAFAQIRQQFLLWVIRLRFWQGSGLYSPLFHFQGLACRQEQFLLCKTAWLWDFCLSCLQPLSGFRIGKPAVRLVPGDARPLWRWSLPLASTSHRSTVVFFLLQEKSEVFPFEKVVDQKFTLQVSLILVLPGRNLKSMGLLQICVLNFAAWFICSV